MFNGQSQTLSHGSGEEHAEFGDALDFLNLKPAQDYGNLFPLPSVKIAEGLNLHRSFMVLRQHIGVVGKVNIAWL